MKQAGKVTHTGYLLKPFTASKLPVAKHVFGFPPAFLYFSSSEILWLCDYVLRWSERGSDEGTINQRANHKQGAELSDTISHSQEQALDPHAKHIILGVCRNISRWYEHTTGPKLICHPLYSGLASLKTIHLSLRNIPLPATNQQCYDCIWASVFDTTSCL